MGTIQSMILDGEDPKKEKAPVVPAIQEEVKPIEQIPDNAAPVSNAVASTRSNEAAAHVTDPKQSDIQHGEQSSKKFESNADIVDAIYKKRMPTEEELAKEKKREKSRQVISAIADGVSAISNLYFTGKGAKNVEQTSMSAANTKRYQEILERRRKMQDKWDDARLNASVRDMEQANRLEAAKIERVHREALLKAKTDAEVEAIQRKYANDLSLLLEKNKAVGIEGDKNRINAANIAKSNNTATVRAAGIRSSNSGDSSNSDKEFTNISDGKGGSVRVRIKDVTPENIGKVYAGMIEDNPEFAIKEQGKDAVGGPAKDDKGNPIMVTVPNPTADQMRAAIGRSIGKSKSVQDSYKEISGYGNSNSGASKKKIKGF